VHTHTEQKDQKKELYRKKRATTFLIKIKYLFSTVLENKPSHMVYVITSMCPLAQKEKHYFHCESQCILYINAKIPLSKILYPYIKQLRQYCHLN
jgi:hypothetical protein